MIFDLFSGPRGWDVGLRGLGREDSLGFEIDPVANRTAELNGFRYVECDVSALDPSAVEFEFGTPEAVIGSPVCTPFSNAGAGLGREDMDSILATVHNIALGWPVDDEIAELLPYCQDPLSRLSLEPLRWLLALMPEWGAFEQVPAVLPLWEACAEVLRLKGYSVVTGVLSAEQYGVPQTRRRAVMILSRVKQVHLPPPTHSKYHSREPERLDPGLLKWVSMADAIKWGMPDRPAFTITGGGTNTGGAEPFAKTSRTAMLERMDVGPWVQRSNYSAPGTPGMTAAERGRTTRSLDEPSPSITGKGFEWESPAARVRVNAQEAAALQSFPATYLWHGNKGQVMQQIGNAVPPFLGWHVLRAAGA